MLLYLSLFLWYFESVNDILVDVFVVVDVVVVQLIIDAAVEV